MAKKLSLNDFEGKKKKPAKSKKVPIKPWPLAYYKLRFAFLLSYITTGVTIFGILLLAFDIEISTPQMPELMVTILNSKIFNTVILLVIPVLTLLFAKITRVFYVVKEIISRIFTEVIDWGSLLGEFGQGLLVALTAVLLLFILLFVIFFLPTVIVLIVFVDLGLNPEDDAKYEEIEHIDEVHL